MSKISPKCTERGQRRLELCPITIQDAKLFVSCYHRHHQPPASGLFAVAVHREGAIVGVAIVGRPVARGNQDGWTAEVTRLATDGTKNACSILYGAAWRACRALGYRRLVTYTLASEPGTSLKAVGWRCIGKVHARSWNCKSRPRIDHSPLQEKLKWEAPMRKMGADPGAGSERDGDA